MKMVYTKYMENLVRSAIAPDTMVAAVAQNTVWKIRNPSMGSPLSMTLSIMSRLKKCGVPTKPPTPNINPKPMNQKRMEPNIKSIRFFISTLAVFLVRINPASTKANPGCMKNTSMAASSIHTVFRPVTISLMASVSVLLTGVSDSASCAQRLAGNRNKSIKSLFRYSFSIPFLLVVSIIFSLKL